MLVGKNMKILQKDIWTDTGIRQQVIIKAKLSFHLIALKTICLKIAKSYSLNKRPMGHIAHLRKQFKSINTYDYIITLINLEKKTLLTS